MSLNRTRFRYSGAEEISFDYYSGLPIDYPTGAAEITATVSTVRTPDGIGAETQIATVPARPITINGYIIAPPSVGVRRELERTFAPLTAGRLWAETEEEEAFFLDCISAAAPTIEGLTRFPRFQLSLSANYPYWQAEKEQEITLSLTGQRITAAVDVQSDVPALFSLQIIGTGAAGGITLADDLSGEELAYSGSIAAGEQLRIAIDGAGRVEATAAGADVIGKVLGGLKKLQPGRRNLTLRAGSNGGTLTAKIIYREARASV